MDYAFALAYEDPLKAADTLADELQVTAPTHDAQGRMSPEVMPRLHAAGLAALTVPVAHGGRGANLALAAAVLSRIARGDPSVALVLAMQYIYHAVLAHTEDWAPAVRHRVGAAAAHEGALLNALRAEPELGTPSRGGLPGTCARRADGGWVVSGTKAYATGGDLLRWALVWARTDDEEPLLGYFLVPLDAPGVSIKHTWNHIGMRATGSHTVVLDNVLIPSDHVGALKPPQQCERPDTLHMLWNNTLIAALYDGIAQSARAWLVGYLKTRTPTNLGAPLATLARFQETVGEMDALLLVNRCVLESLVAAEAMPLEARAQESGLAKYLLTTHSQRVVEMGLAAIGNPGLSRSFPLERLYRDVLCGRVHVPQNDMVLRSAGRVALSS